jgi:hypothetical protein
MRASLKRALSRYRYYPRAKRIVKAEETKKASRAQTSEAFAQK